MGQSFFLQKIKTSRKERERYCLLGRADLSKLASDLRRCHCGRFTVSTSACAQACASVLLTMRSLSTSMVSLPSIFIVPPLMLKVHTSSHEL